MTVSEQSRRDRCFLCASPTAGQASGEAEGDTPADAGAAVDGGAVAQTGPVQAGGREEEPRRVHEEERRVHKPAGAGAREVSAPIRRQSSQKWAAGPPMNIVTRHLVTFDLKAITENLILVSGESVSVKLTF